MKKSHRWTVKQIEFLRELAKHYQSDEIAKRFNKEFGTNFSKEYINVIRSNNGILVKRIYAEYALYKGEEILATGTMKEIAEQTGVLESTIKYYSLSTYVKKVSEKGRRLVRIS